MMNKQIDSTLPSKQSGFVKINDEESNEAITVERQEQGSQERALVRPSAQFQKTLLVVIFLLLIVLFLMSINLNKKIIAEQIITRPSSDQHSDHTKNTIEQNTTLSVLTSEDQIKQKELELINLSQPQKSVVQESVPQPQPQAQKSVVEESVPQPPLQPQPQKSVVEESVPQPPLQPQPQKSVVEESVPQPPLQPQPQKSVVQESVPQPPLQPQPQAQKSVVEESVPQPPLQPQAQKSVVEESVPQPPLESAEQTFYESLAESKQAGADKHTLQLFKRIQAGYTPNHEEIIYKSKTVGVPEGKGKFNQTKVQTYDLIKFDQQINKLLQPFDNTDCQLKKFGSRSFSSYLVCENLLTNSKALLNIGIYKEDSFGCQLTTLYPMPNYQFDCTQTTKPKCKTNFQANNYTYACVGQITQNVFSTQFYSLEDIIKKHNLQKTHIIVKMDVGGGEYPAFSSFPLQYLDYIDQLIIQFHFGRQSPQVWGHLDVIKTLSNNFVNVNYFTPYQFCVIDSRKTDRYFRRLPGMVVTTTLVNKKIIKLITDSRSYNINPLNGKGCPTPPQRELTDPPEKIINNIQINQISDTSSHIPSVQHVDEEVVFEFPSVGTPEAGKSFNTTILTYDFFRVYDEQINQILQPYNNTNCEYQKFGNFFGGKYVACKNFFKQSQALINLGIDGEDSFGCEITTEFPMPNYQYDCINKIIPQCPTNKQANYFSPACVGEKTEKTDSFIFYTLEDILKRHDLLKKRVSIKMQLDGREWRVLKNLPIEYLDYIDQLVIEIHFGEKVKEQWGNLDILKTLSTKFVNVNYYGVLGLCWECGMILDNRILPAKAVQLTLVNKNLITLYSDSRSFKMHPINEKSCTRP